MGKYFFSSFFWRKGWHVEGWHTQLAAHAGQRSCAFGLNLYLLLDVLYEEAVRVDIATHMLQQGQNMRRERKTFKILNEALFGLWAQHSERIINSSQLLAKVAVSYTSADDAC